MQIAIEEQRSQSGVEWGEQMEKRLATLRINAERFSADFDALAEIGSTGDGLPDHRHGHGGQ